MKKTILILISSIAFPLFAADFRVEPHYFVKAETALVESQYVPRGFGLTITASGHIIEGLSLNARYRNLYTDLKDDNLGDDYWYEAVTHQVGVGATYSMIKIRTNTVSALVDAESEYEFVDAKHERETQYLAVQLGGQIKSFISKRVDTIASFTYRFSDINLMDEDILLKAEWDVRITNAFTVRPMVQTAIDLDTFETGVSIGYQW